MTLAEALQRAVEAGDPGEAARLLLEASEKERRAAAKEMPEPESGAWYREISRSPQRLAASAVVLLGTSTSAEMRRRSWRLSRVPWSDEAVAVLAARPAAIRESVAKWIVNNDFGTGLWPLLRGLIDKGVVERPTEPGYFVGYATTMLHDGHRVWHRDPQQRFEAMKAHLMHRLRTRPDFVDELFEAFAVEDAVMRMRAMKENSQAWIAAVSELAGDGTIDRGRLIDACLDGHLRDFRPAATRMFAAVYGALDVTLDEAAARADRFPRLLASPDPGAQKLAIAELRRLDKADRDLDPVAVAEACRQPLTGTQKNVAMGALRLLAAVAASDPNDALMIAVTGLGHSRTDVQETAVQLLERHGDTIAADTSLAADLLGWVDVVSPVLRPRIVALTGMGDLDAVVDEHIVTAPIALPDDIPERVSSLLRLGEVRVAVEGGPWPDAVDFAPSDPHVLSEAMAITQIDDLGELVETLTAVLAGSGDAIDGERSLDALSRLCARQPSGFGTLVSPLVKALERYGGIDWLPVRGVGLAATVACWIRGHSPPAPGFLSVKKRRFGRSSELVGTLVKPPPPQYNYYRSFDGGVVPSELDGMVAARCWEVAARMGRRTAQPLLATMTHRGGWLDTGTAAARLAWYRKHNVRPNRFDAIQAVMRLPRIDDVAMADQFLSLGGDVARAMARVCGADTTIEDEGLMRAAAVERPMPVPVPDTAPERSRLRKARRLIFPTEPTTQPRRDDPVGVIEHGLRDADNRWFTWGRFGYGGGRTNVLWATTVAPRRPDILAAALASGIAYDLDANRSSDDDDLVMSKFADWRVPLGDAANSAIALSLSSKNEALATATIDVVGAAAEDGRLDALRLGSMIAMFVNAGVVKPARIMPRLTIVAGMSDLHAEVVRRISERVVAELDDVPRDLHTILQVLNEVGAGLGRGIPDRSARELLTTLTGGSKSSKRAKLASALLELPTEWAPGEPERLAYEGRIATAAEWTAA